MGNDKDSRNAAQTALELCHLAMDISLPILNGYEATRKIRGTMPSTPIIGLSAHAMDGHEQKARDAGCNDYLTKPVNDNLLFEMLKKYLGE